MKKILICLAALGLVGCSSVEKRIGNAIGSIERNFTNTTRVCHKTQMGTLFSIEEIEGHFYIISSCGGITHAEHCPCKMK